MRNPMIFASLFVMLACGSAWLWRNQCRIGELRVENAHLAGEVKELGVPIPAGADGDASKDPRGNDRRSSRELPDFDVSGFLNEVVRRYPNGIDSPDKRELMDYVFNILIGLNRHQLKEVLAEARFEEVLDPEVRLVLSDECLKILAERFPEDALALLEKPEHVSEEGAQCLALRAWARQDAPAAFGWLSEHISDLRKPAAHSLKHAFLHAVAEDNPAFALGLIRQLALEDEKSTAKSIGRMARAEDRDSVLAAVRERASGTEAEEAASGIGKGVLSGLAVSMAGEPFDDTVSWIETSRLTRAEIDAFVDGIDGGLAADREKWLGWIAENTQGDHRKEAIENFVSRWTSHDYKAVAAWIGQAPEDAVKTVAVRAFAEAVAPYDLTGAEEWALTLPPGENRRATLDRIYRRWPLDDADGRAAFAAKHGLDGADGN